VAKIIGVTRERVRSLELTALAKLRHAFSKHLDPLEPEVFATA
jgi:DNA-directed RNA polymerase sigma subunit (sigma70/sigma32)